MGRVLVVLAALLAGAGLAAGARADARHPSPSAPGVRQAPAAKGDRPSAPKAGPTSGPVAGKAARRTPAASEAPLPALDAKALFARLDAARKAHRWVVVHFWATWCPPCVEELPRVLEAAPAWRRRAEVLLLAVVQPKDAALARKMAGDGPGRFRLAVDDPEVLARRLDPGWHGALPATFVINPKGKVVYRVVGPMDDKSVNRALGIPRAR